jgi:hypothetical protein
MLLGGLPSNRSLASDDRESDGIPDRLRLTSEPILGDATFRASGVGFGER